MGVWGCGSLGAGCLVRPLLSHTPILPYAHTLQLLKELSQALPLDQLHREVEVAVRILAELVDGDDVGMFELARDLGLFQESQPMLFGVRDLGPHHLDRQFPLDRFVPRHQHRPHPSVRQLPLGVVRQLQPSCPMQRAVECFHAALRTVWCRLWRH